MDEELMWKSEYDRHKEETEKKKKQILMTDYQLR